MTPFTSVDSAPRRSAPSRWSFRSQRLTGLISAGATGGSASSAIGCALDALESLLANSPAYHALVMGIAAGIVYLLVFVIFGTTFYAAKFPRL